MLWIFSDPFASPEHAESWLLGLDTPFLILALKIVEAVVVLGGVEVEVVIYGTAMLLDAS